MFEVRAAFFNPLWRRVVFAGAICGWAVVELALGNGAWGAVFAAAGAYLVYQFFWIWTPVEPPDPEE